MSTHYNDKENCKLSVIIPCYNEEKTLNKCIDNVLQISDEYLSLEIIIVDDYSDDNSYKIACDLENQYQEISVFKHNINQGKGAALRTGFNKAKGDYVAVQDADLEYDPQDLKKLIVPLRSNDADVVFGSRFLSSGAHRVLYFWHYLGNRFLTLLSNIFTDLNLTDMETCYKIFRREVIQNIKIEENRFGFEPEIVAKVAQMRLRIYEMGISYHGRTYAEGKKIGIKDGIRALYCIFRYNAHKAPIPIQFFLYLFIGGVAATINYIIFLSLFSFGYNIFVASPVAFIISAIVNYYLCILILFRHKIRWGALLEVFIFTLIVFIGAFIDLIITSMLFNTVRSIKFAKIISIGFLLIYNFIARRFLVFPEKTVKPWE